MTSHEAPLNLRCGVTAVVPCGAPLAAPYENPHDVPVVDGASRVTKPMWGRFPSVPSSGGCSRFGALTHCASDKEQEQTRQTEQSVQTGIIAEVMSPTLTPIKSKSSKDNKSIKGVFGALATPKWRYWGKGA